MINSEFLVLAEKVKNLKNEDFKKLYLKTQNKRLIVARAYFDLQFFAKFFFSTTQPHHLIEGKTEVVGHTKDPFNQMHFDYFRKFNPSEKSAHTLIRASRGSAKTTLLCIIDPLHRICFGTEKYIVILSSTAPLARQKSKDIYSEIINNDKLRLFFNLTLRDKKISKEAFMVKSDFGSCFIQSQGFFSQIRGTKVGSERPTRIIYDDVTHGEGVFSEAQREKAERQFNTDIKQSSQPGTNHILIGTALHAEDLLNKLHANPMYESSTYKAIIKWPTNMNLWDDWENIYKDTELNSKEKGIKALKFYTDNKKKMNEGCKVLWEDREDIHYLMKERLTIGRRAFGAEKQMEPFLTGEALFQNIRWFYPTEFNGNQGYYIEQEDRFIENEYNRFQYYYALDPSTGERKSNTKNTSLSQSARLICAKDIETGNIYVLDAIMDRKPPSDIIYEMYELHNIYNFVRMGFEENLFRDLFRDAIKLVKKEYAENNRGYAPDLPWHSIWASKSKENRIYSVEPLVSAGKVLFNKYLSPNFLTQLQDYPNCDHNDGLDALEIMCKITDSKTKLSKMAFSSIKKHTSRI